MPMLFSMQEHWICLGVPESMRENHPFLREIDAPAAAISFGCCSTP
jgi:hypothetical protein